MVPAPREERTLSSMPDLSPGAAWIGGLESGNMASMAQASRGTIAFLGACLAITCGGEPFTTAEAEGGASGDGGRGGGAAGQPSVGGGGTGAVTGGGGGGEAGGGESAGAAGEAPGCACNARQYCRADNCRDCADYSSLDFGAPELLAGPGLAPDGSPRFPRAGPAQGSLFYRAGSGSAARIWYTPAEDTAGSRASSGSTLESGPLFLPSPAILGNTFAFDGGPVGERAIYLAAWQATGFANATEAGEPLNQDGSESYGLAVALDTERAFWISTRSGAAELLSAPASGTIDDVEPVTLELSAPGGATCDPDPTLLSPWVTPDGRLLLLSQPRFDATCTPLDDGALALYAVPLQPASGQPVASAVPLTTTFGPDGSTETDPSLSPEGCSLYFASDRSGALQLYRAGRE